MDISRESPDQTQRRLRQVIAAADFSRLGGLYDFEEHPAAAPPHDRLTEALVAVRDDEVWSLLVPRPVSGPFALFRFYFPPKLDNSGFVGWLASALKTAVGTGVFVVCGQNSGRGGIFDYWGVPAEVAEACVHEINRLRAPAAEYAEAEPSDAAEDGGRSVFRDV